MRAEGPRLVCRRHSARVHDFAVGGSSTTVAVADSVMRRDAGFGIGSDGAHSSAAAKMGGTFNFPDGGGAEATRRYA